MSIYPPLSSDPATTLRRNSTDLLRWKVLGPLLRWRHARSLLQAPLLVVAGLMIWHGLTGPSLSPKNLATVLGWVHYRGLLVASLLIAGNLFCMACPFMLPRELARRFVRPARRLPARLRNKWTGLALLVGILFAYELFDLWASPWWTAWLIAGYFGAALLVDSLFRDAAFCKYVCPIGQFNFVASAMSPLEVAAQDQSVCASCKTHDCLRGRVDGEGRVLQRGCEMGLFLPKKVGNTDCTFCLDCVHACPHDNVGIVSRIPASDLLVSRNRSGVGQLFQRKDLSALAVVFTFGALLNTFGMVSPVYAVEQFLSNLTGIRHEAPILAALFAFALVIEPVLLLGGAAYVMRRATRSREGVGKIAGRFAFALVPFGTSVWAAHYGFHFLTGLWTWVPVLQGALAGMGIPLLGAPRWDLGGLPAAYVYPLELSLLTLGCVSSLVVAYGLSRDLFGPSSGRIWRGFLPWAAVCVVLLASALWLLSQPMEMRATLLGA